MKKVFIFSLIVLSLMVVGACTRPASPSVTSSVDGLPYPAATQPTGGEAEEPQGGEGVEEPAATATQVIIPESTQAQPPAAEPTKQDGLVPTATPLPAKPTATPLAPVDINQPTVAPTLGPSPAPVVTSVAFDPRATWGDPTYEDPLDLESKSDWARLEDGVLPDTVSFEIEIKDNKFYVTGKQMGFSTWWFSWPSIKDFYIELEANSKTCVGKDAYGLILRGPEHLAGVSYGYVVALSCDGSYWVFRLDGIDPWRAVTLQDWKASSLVKAGSDQTNVLGVRMDGDVITVFVNGQSVVELKDDEYSQGRFGLFVRPDSSLTYTYQGLNLAYWDLDELPTPTPKP